MSGFRRFAIVGAGNIGGFIVEELLKQKATGAIDDITIVTRPVSPDRSLLSQIHPPVGSEAMEELTQLRYGPSAGLPRQTAKPILRSARRAPRLRRRIHRRARAHIGPRRRARRHLHDQPDGHRRPGAHRAGRQSRRREPLRAERVWHAHGWAAGPAQRQGRAARQAARGGAPHAARVHGPVRRLFLGTVRPSPVIFTRRDRGPGG